MQLFVSSNAMGYTQAGHAKLWVTLIQLWVTPTKTCNAMGYTHAGHAKLWA